MRSPNYPAVGLGEAVNLAQAVWGREKRSYAAGSVVVQAWGYAGLSGNARTKLAALRKYGLLEENGGGDFRLSERALHILHQQPDSPERLTALREAALSPDLFAELQMTYGQSSNEAIRSYLMTKKGFSDTGADACIEAFRDTQDIAKLNDMEMATVIPPPSAQGTLPPSISSSARSVAPSTAPVEDATTYRWPLSRGVVAEVRFIGPAKPIHLDLLKSYLDVAKGAMEADAEVEKNEPQ